MDMLKHLERPSVQFCHQQLIDTAQTYINKSQKSGSFSLTIGAKPSPYALCFAIFNLKLIGRDDVLVIHGDRWGRMLVDAVTQERSQYSTPPKNKAYRQLLAFCLSALGILGYFDKDNLEKLVTEQIPDDLEKELKEHGVDQGREQSGNQAMFLAIFVIHSVKILKIPYEVKIQQWVDLHMEWMNTFGFWGPGGMTHLMFQNGYHQYEILEYLGVEVHQRTEAIAAVASLADRQGLFAPYPGGGGCYEYDALFMLTPRGKLPEARFQPYLSQALSAIRANQNDDGGFGESQKIRPRNLSNLYGFAMHVLDALPRKELFAERLRYAITLQRTKHDRRHTHWQNESFGWGQSNLWDTWFRLLAIARIQCAYDPRSVDDWGFIDYPGIGYHQSLAGKI